jgi:glutathione peroxidase
VSIFEIPLTTIDGDSSSLSDYRDKALLVVNVASRCGLTPQYETLEQLQKRYEDRGFSVLGFPSNQFNGQEPGTSDEIKEFCSTTYGVTFPLFEKADVNGDDRQPLYVELTKTADADGNAGDVAWNFEKFLISPSGEVRRFRPQTVPDDPQIIAAIEEVLPA